MLLPSLVRRLLLRKSVEPSPARVRIVKAEVKRLSLCRQGKNGLRTLYKSDGSLRLDTLCKSVDEGTLLAVVYAPERADADGHVADGEVVRQMLHTLMRNGAELDIEHDGKVLSKAQAFVAEAFTVQKSDPRFADWRDYNGQPAGDLTGAAAVQIQIDDPELRAARRRGEWDGISLFGTGEGVPEPLTKSAHQEPPMTPEQIQALALALSKAVTEAVAPLLKPVEKVEPKAEAAVEEKAPAFSGDPTNAGDLETFEKSVRAYEFRKAVASGKMTADQIAELRKSMTEASPTDVEAGIEKGDPKEVRDLKLRLFKAQRRSNAPASGTAAPERGQNELDTAEGLELAKSLNGDGKPAAFAWNVH